MTKSATAATTSAPATGVAPAAASVKKKARVTPEIIGVSTAVAMPTNRSASRGSKSLYNFDALEVGQSIAVKNKTANELSSVISAQNRKKSNFKQKVDANGNPLFVMTEIKDANGAVVGKTATTEPELEPIKHFFAADCAKDDPEGATVRIWRDK